MKKNLRDLDYVVYKNKCKCKEDAILTLTASKPGDLTKLREKEEKKEEKRKEKGYNGKANLYPDSSEVTMRTFHIPWTTELSWVAKLTLNSFQKKHLYHAMDDILYTPNIAVKERDDLLALLYSPALSLHNARSINFFDIWINELHIKKILKTNRFLDNEFQSSYQITMKVVYKIKLPRRDREPLW